MRSITLTAVAAGLLAAAATLPVAVSAQTTATPAATSAPADPRTAVEQRIADMHATLKITAAQEPQFDQFAQVMLDNAQSMQAALSRNNADPAQRSAEQILAAYADTVEQHAQNVERLSGAFSMLYATLSPEQKSAADDMFRSVASDREQKKTGG